MIVVVFHRQIFSEGIVKIVIPVCHNKFHFCNIANTEFGSKILFKVNSSLIIIHTGNIADVHQVGIMAAIIIAAIQKLFNIFKHACNLYAGTIGKSNNSTSTCCCLAADNNKACFSYKLPQGFNAKSFQDISFHFIPLIYVIYFPFY